MKELGRGDKGVFHVCVFVQVWQACIKGLHKKLKSNNNKWDIKDNEVAIV